MKIQFSCEPHLRGAIPDPRPAVKLLPEYFKKLKPQVNSHPSSGTAKRCVPFLDALSSGFIIPLWSDVFVHASNGELKIDFPENFPLKQSLGHHSFDQIEGHPYSNTSYGKFPMKWINPWLIKTEENVSCLFTSPFNHLERRFKIFDGCVDTDTYYNHINLPFIWTGGDGQFLIQKGTPLVQVIPFRREAVELEISDCDELKIKNTTAILGTKIKDGYRDEFWHKGKFKEQLAEVVPHKVELAEKPAVNSTCKDLDENGLVVLPNLISLEKAEYLSSCLDNYVSTNPEAEPDGFCKLSKSVYGLPEFDRLLEDLTEQISSIAGKNLIPTHSYSRAYITGEELPMHLDRSACQYAMTLCIGMSGEPWPIYIAKPSKEKTDYPCSGQLSGRFMEKPTGVNLNVGDAILYRGLDMIHYRNKFDGSWQNQVFLFWVDADGPYGHEKYDGRSCLNHHLS
jgi:hypothetical protein